MFGEGPPPFRSIAICGAMAPETAIKRLRTVPGMRPAPPNSTGS
jgi:hypothetical protein